MELRMGEGDEGAREESAGRRPFGELRDRDFCTVSELVELAVNLKSFNIPLGSRSKVANGGVAVGFPHRNSPVFKQTPYQSMGSKSGGG